MSPQRRYQRPAALAILLSGALLSACGSAPGPQAAADAYLAAWARQDWAAMQKLTSGPPAGFTAVNQAAFRDLSVRQASFTGGPMQAGQEAASEPVIERLTLAGLGTITIRSAMHLVLSHGTWLVKWSPATIAPPLRAGDQLSLRTTWPARAAVLDTHGTPLTSQGQVVTIGVEGSRIKNAAAVKSALVAAGAPAAAADSAIAAARTHPAYFEPVFTVSRARYTQLEPALYPLPGTVFQAGDGAEHAHARAERRPGRHDRAGDSAAAQPARRAVCRAGHGRADRPGAGRRAPAGLARPAPPSRWCPAAVRMSRP